MRNSFICPFFGLDKSRCSRGFGYISPEEGKEIVDNCISNFRHCPKYFELNSCKELISSVRDIERHFGRMLSPYSLLR